MKKRNILYLLVFATGLITSCGNHTEEKKEESKYSYESFENDPYQTRIYTLDNGLKVYISENHSEPRIFTGIAVKTGSVNDPKDATGLAHYLEHMLFKGTSELGALNWAEEEKQLQLISDLYEKHRATTDEEERKAIYHQIDSVSQEAAKNVATNEYDKLMSNLGASGTNAFTSNERTVYINDIPSNEIDKWMTIESERFSELVLRLFHTELEAVYEEFNMSQDRDYTQMYFKMLDLLFPNHPYGQQTTIGTGEHLKNPSMEKIHAYFDARYVPNNMAIILSGDVDPDQAIELVDKHFGGYAKKPVSNPEMPKEEPITEVETAVVKGPSAEEAMVAFRLNGVHSKDYIYSELLSRILSNGTAGLMDLNLEQSQKVLSAGAYSSVMKDYGMFNLYGNPREGQTLDEVKDLLLAQLDSVKQGNFEDWLISASARMMKKEEIGYTENNMMRFYYLMDAFILDIPWEDMIHMSDSMANITKEDLMQWTSETFKDNNYVYVKKEVGESDPYKVDKPEITQVNLNRDTTSTFADRIDSMPEMRMKPEFLDFKKLVKTGDLVEGVEVQYVQNDINELNRMYYVFEMGSNQSQMIPLAFEYLPYLGTSKLSPAEVQKELYRLALDFDVFPGEERSYVIVNCLEENFEESFKFFEMLLKEVQANPEAYTEMVKGMLKERANSKLNKYEILYGGMWSYAKYGAENPYNNKLSKAELEQLNPEELVSTLHQLNDYPHRIMFYGPQSFDGAMGLLKDNHQVADQLLPIPEGKTFEEKPTEGNKVLFVDYDMVQTWLTMINRGPAFNPEILSASRVFNEYFGSGLSSIVFQEIRESRALAYSSYVNFGTPTKADEHHYIRGFIGTQSNKLSDATAALLELLAEMPRAEKQFEQAKLNAMKNIETNRTTGSSILWQYQRAQDLGIDYDINEKIYGKLDGMTFDELNTFFTNQIKGKPFTYLVMGKKGEVDMEALQKLGKVEELTLEELFGY